MEFFANRPSFKTTFLETSLYYTSYSFVFFLLLQFASRFVFTYIFNFAEYQKLQKEGKTSDWDSRIVSSIHAFISTTLAFLCYVWYPKIFQDILYYHEDFFTLTLCVTTGYLLADLWVVLADFDLYMAIHHIIGAIGLFSSAMSGYSCFVTITFCFTEISTPFVNLRWQLYLLGKKDSFLYKLNGILLTFFFGAVRMAFIVIFYYKLHQQWDDYIKGSIYGILAIGIQANTIHVLNVIWFYKIFTGLLKALTSKDKKE